MREMNDAGFNPYEIPNHSFSGQAVFGKGQIRCKGHIIIQM